VRKLMNKSSIPFWKKDNVASFNSENGKTFKRIRHCNNDAGADTASKVRTSKVRTVRLGHDLYLKSASLFYAIVFVYTFGNR